MNFMPGNMEKKSEMSTGTRTQHGKFRPSWEEKSMRQSVALPLAGYLRSELTPCQGIEKI